MRRGCCWSWVFVAEKMSRPGCYEPAQELARWHLQDPRMDETHVTTSLSPNLLLPMDKEHCLDLSTQPSSLVLKGEALSMHPGRKEWPWNRNDAVDAGDAVDCSHRHCKNTKNCPKSSSAAYRD